MHVPWTLPFLRYPSHGVIQQSITFTQNVEYMKLRYACYHASNNIDVNDLFFSDVRKAMLTNMDVNLRQAKRVWNVDKNYYRAKKRIVRHSLILLIWN
jgi:hypothetical protein